MRKLCGWVLESTKLFSGGRQVLPLFIYVGLYLVTAATTMVSICHNLEFSVLLREKLLFFYLGHTYKSYQIQVTL